METGISPVTGSAVLGSERYGTIVSLPPLMQPRNYFRPFEYEECYEFWNIQTNNHWLHSEVQMNEDIMDWKVKLTDKEKRLIGTILKSFTQTEVIVGDYWTQKISKWFPKPEVALMASCFGSMEGIHQVAYAYLNDTLGLTNYEAFLQDPVAKARLDRLTNIKAETVKEIGLATAVFSGFTEGVSLFSSFAILASFSPRNLLKGVGQIITWSVRDESLHSRSGVRLFNNLCGEVPGLRQEMESEIHEAAELSIKLEDDLVESAFDGEDLPNLTQDTVQNYIRYRANVKLEEMGYTPQFSVDNAKVAEKMQWFNLMTNGQEFTDFFAQRVTEYSKTGAWDDAF